MAAIWKHSSFQVHQVLVNQDLQKIGKEELTSLTARVSISLYCSNGKDGKTYDLLIQYMAQDVTP